MEENSQIDIVKVSFFSRFMSVVKRLKDKHIVILLILLVSLSLLLIGARYQQIFQQHASFQNVCVSQKHGTCIPTSFCGGNHICIGNYGCPRTFSCSQPVSQTSIHYTVPKRNTSFAKNLAVRPMPTPTPTPSGPTIQLVSSSSICIEKNFMLVLTFSTNYDLYQHDFTSFIVAGPSKYDATDPGVSGSAPDYTLTQKGYHQFVYPIVFSDVNFPGITSLKTGDTITVHLKDIYAQGHVAPQNYDYSYATWDSNAQNIDFPYQKCN